MGKGGRMAKKKKDPERDSLEKELEGIIPQLDTEGLVFIIEQARVHLYNMRVDELNEAAVAANQAAARSAGKKGSAKTAPDNLRIDGTESGSSYYLHFRNDEIMFSRDEMIRLVRIAGGKGTDLEIRERLYNWFDRERRDIFALVPIKDKFDERLKALAALLKKNFKIQGK